MDTPLVYDALAMDAGHRQVDHTADLAFEIWAPTEPELLVEAARAIVDTMTEGAKVADDAPHTVRIDALDPEDRLVQWLNEVIYLATVSGYLLADAALELTEPGHLVAQLRGESSAASKLRSELKSATYHDLRLERTQDGLRAFVVIDV